ncbi:hypothetical protein BJ508DRAFT_215373 [Ascobolus immersus RN42]|uniref:Uncharacterized protein n=1 Tax=Ascobolus immersus RN42 TaxID=1160509 RepID=A0A3N4HKY1_ASCIM|nr:hypothetical protein BJ508DRAFT_215373 [Ascobolus immersus RN42]
MCLLKSHWHLIYVNRASRIRILSSVDHEGWRLLPTVSLLEPPFKFIPARLSAAQAPTDATEPRSCIVHPELITLNLTLTEARPSKTYSTTDSRVVTHHSTNLAIRSLTMGERTGSRVFFNLWPYNSA